MHMFNLDHVIRVQTPHVNLVIGIGIDSTKIELIKNRIEFIRID